MLTETGNNIVKYIKERGEATASGLVDFLLISPQAVFRQLKKLQEKGQIAKFGSPPRVFYVLAGEKHAEVGLIDKKVSDFINDNYLYVTPDGLSLEGVAGFTAWCQKNGFEPNKTAKECMKRSRKILLIDDAVGSGATLNETARKIKEKLGGKTKVIGLSLTESFKDFDVISEV